MELLLNQQLPIIWIILTENWNKFLKTKMSCGGWCNEIKVADDHVQNLVNQVKFYFDHNRINILRLVYQINNKSQFGIP